MKVDGHLALNEAVLDKNDPDGEIGIYLDEWGTWYDPEEGHEPGTMPGITSLVEEGGEELTTINVLDTFSRHFLSLLDTWMNDGFADAVQNWSGRVEGRSETVDVPHPTGAMSGRVLGLDEDGNLLVKCDDGATAALALLDCLTPASPPEAG